MVGIVFSLQPTTDHPNQVMSTMTVHPVTRTKGFVTMKSHPPFPVRTYAPMITKGCVALSSSAPHCRPESSLLGLPTELRRSLSHSRTTAPSCSGHTDIVPYTYVHVRITQLSVYDSHTSYDSIQLSVPMHVPLQGCNALQSSLTSHRVRQGFLRVNACNSQF